MADEEAIRGSEVKQIKSLIDNLLLSVKEYAIGR